MCSYSVPVSPVTLSPSLQCQNPCQFNSSDYSLFGHKPRMEGVLKDNWVKSPFQSEERNFKPKVEEKCSEHNLGKMVKLGPSDSQWEDNQDGGGK